MPQHKPGFLCVVSQRGPTQSWSLLCMLQLQDKHTGWSPGLSCKSGASQLPSLQILKPCCHRITVLQVTACAECSTNFFHASGANLLVWQGDPAALGQNSPYDLVPPCLSVMHICVPFLILRGGWTALFFTSRRTAVTQTA